MTDVVCLSNKDREELVNILAYLLASSIPQIVLSVTPVLVSDSVSSSTSTVEPKQIRQKRIKGAVYGTNDVMKLLERGTCGAVVVCKGCPAPLYKYIIEAARLRGAPILLVPRGSASLSRVFGMRQVSAIGVVQSSAIYLQNDGLNNYDALCAAIDKTVDFITEKAAQVCTWSKECITSDDSTRINI
jgi:ribosomal protein L7Ae-like RNA K-turn-binding protein